MNNLKRVMVILILIIITNVIFAENYPYPVKYFTGKYGYINTSGEFVIDAKYDAAEQFSEDLALVQLDNDVICIDPAGKEVFRVDHRLKKPYIFTEGLALMVDKKNRKDCFVNTKGQVVIKATDISQSTSILSGFNDGLALINDGELYGYMDKKGKVVIKPQFREARPFSDGMARVKYEIRGDYGYIDVSGKPTVRPQFKHIAYDFSEGFAFVYHPSEGYSFIDKDGNVKIKLKDLIKPLNSGYDLITYDNKELESFSEGISLIQLNVIDYSGILYAINKEGKLLFEKKSPDDYKNKAYIDSRWWSSFRPFYNGKALVHLKRNMSQKNPVGWGIMNKNGDIVYEVQDKWWCKTIYQNGLCKVGVNISKYTSKNGYINEDGEIVYEE